MEKFRSRIMEEADVRRALARIAHEIIERVGGENEVCLIGIRRRGEPLAHLIAENIEKFSDITVYCGTVDITFFRDDLAQKSTPPAPPAFPVEGKTVILVDDVIYTGRSVRAALEAVLSWGRPARIQLAVLIDRGHRELPIRADFVGKNVPTSTSERIGVMMEEIDGGDGVALFEGCVNR